MRHGQQSTQLRLVLGSLTIAERMAARIITRTGVGAGRFVASPPRRLAFVSGFFHVEPGVEDDAQTFGIGEYVDKIRGT